ncbi:hypothetical protein P168DRAFT_290209 [Aspergillus campestris IBT 28561]|uniref:Cyanovirin-N domain-containing protein n=1 Tax=Aspergillus campestris (strain IBT 28561) TaxID=1392248 RepID=A0A2I1D2K1_ASPC2|nr:uncharacterized protein P168DRAFT_290209 [Aspergillus campestris IBT 28561]PKY04111.1 hypothetical protein P168DRAFT_290209 [Aspergillus campestris IBT 28561]
MRFSTVLITLGAVSGAAAARCTEGLTYCGTSICWKGDYHADIVACLSRPGKPQDSSYILYSRFLCTADEDFLIWVDKCRDGRCKDNGRGRDDTCS